MIPRAIDYVGALKYADNIHRIAVEFRSTNPFSGFFEVDVFNTNRGKLAFLSKNGSQIYAEFFDDNEFHCTAKYMSYAPDSELKINRGHWPIESTIIPLNEIKFITEEMYFQESLVLDPVDLNIKVLFGALLYHYKYKQPFFLDFEVYDVCMEYLNA